jgi:L-threonylcarbamoyladenylate synthase
LRAAGVRGARTLGEALAELRAGGLVAYPTETVFGLGADARCAAALARLKRWKGRGGTPLSILVTGLEDAPGLGLEVPEAARRLAAAFWPGPVTLVLPGPGCLAPGVARDDGAVGLRCSPHPTARALAQACARAGIGPPTATSLNRSGEPPAARRAEAERLCGEGAGAPLVLRLPGPDAGGEPPSAVLDCTGAEPRVLRSGALDLDALARALERP